MAIPGTMNVDFERQRRLRAWLELLVVYTVLVILWGAWVRISHSGDGCGDSWPLCEGQFVPAAPKQKTLVELSHRLMSGLFGIFVLAGFVRTRQVFAKTMGGEGHPARFWAGASLALTVTEALLGAKLVLFGLVGTNDSAFRVFAMGLHFVNSALLVGSIASWTLSVDPYLRKTSVETWGVLTARAVRTIRAGAIGALFTLGITGTIAALSTTLFPSESLTAGLAADFHEQAHFIQRWRISHPLLGLTFGSLGVTFFYILGRSVPREYGWIRWRAHRVAFLFFAAAVIGTTTLFLLSPVPLKLVHLACAHLLWIAIVAWMHGHLYEPRGADDRRPILFFDGVCNLCHATVRRLLAMDRRELLLFGSLQGETARRLLPDGARENMKSVVLYQDGLVLQKSDAAIATLQFLPWEFRMFGLIARPVPRFIRDAFYDWIARNRYAWFGRKGVCALPAPEAPAHRDRLLP